MRPAAQTLRAATHPARRAPPLLWAGAPPSRLSYHERGTRSRPCPPHAARYTRPEAWGRRRSFSRPVLAVHGGGDNGGPGPCPECPSPSVAPDVLLPRLAVPASPRSAPPRHPLLSPATQAAAPRRASQHQAETSVCVVAPGSGGTGRGGAVGRPGQVPCIPSRVRCPRVTRPCHCVAATAGGRGAAALINTRPPAAGRAGAGGRGSEVAAARACR